MKKPPPVGLAHVATASWLASRATPSGGFVIALAGLAWWIISADRESDPRTYMERTAERFDARWGMFERDLWAHVAAVVTETR